MILPTPVNTVGLALVFSIVGQLRTNSQAKHLLQVTQGNTAKHYEPSQTGTSDT